MRWCFAWVIAGCFSDPPVVEGGSEDPTSASTSASTTTTTTTSSSSSSSASSSTSTSTATATSTSTSGDVTTSVETSSDPSSSGGTERCVTLDFEGIPIACANGSLALPAGLAQVTFASGGMATMQTPCIEDASDASGWTAPLSGRYVFVEIQPNNPATITVDAPLASVKFDVGPHYVQDGTANIALCATTMGGCENTEVTGDQSMHGTLSKDMAGATTLYLYMTKATGLIAIDDLQLCFD